MDRPDLSADPAPPAPRAPRRLTSAGDVEPVERAQPSKPARAPFGVAGARMAPDMSLHDPLAAGAQPPDELRSARLLLINLMAALLIGALVGAAAMLEAIGPRPTVGSGPIATQSGPASDMTPAESPPAASVQAEPAVQAAVLPEAPTSGTPASMQAPPVATPADRAVAASEDDRSATAPDTVASDPALAPDGPAAGAAAPQRAFGAGSGRTGSEATTPRRSEPTARVARQAAQARPTDPYCRALDGLALAQCRQCDHMGAIPRGFCEHRVRLAYCSGRYGRTADCPLPAVTSPN